MEDATPLMIATPHWLAAVLLGVLGAIFGSFIAAIVIRWPQDRSVMHGRSACDACGRVLGAAELVPLMSGIVSGGRCRTCRAAIDPLHWRIEALALLIGAGAGALLPLDQAAAAALFYAPRAVSVPLSEAASRMARTKQTARKSAGPNRRVAEARER